jgi:hypothetical protein
MAVQVQLVLYGMFLYAKEQDASSHVSKVWILGVDGRSSRLASDSRTFISSHWPALAINTDYLKDYIDNNNLPYPEDFISHYLKKQYLLWTLDGHSLSFEYTGKKTTLSGNFDPRPNGAPTPTNEHDFSWVANMEDVAADPEIDSTLLDSEPTGLACRLALDFGYFSCDLALDKNLHPIDYSFEQLGNDLMLNSYGALANSVTVDLGSFDSLTLHRDPITGTNDKMRTKESIKLELKSDPVVLYLWNSPIEYIGGATCMDCKYVSHFELFYPLLQVQPLSLLVPYSQGSLAITGRNPLNKNVSCPPAQITL